jgi:hypothetical protein
MQAGGVDRYPSNHTEFRGSVFMERPRHACSEIKREDVVAAISTVFDGKTALSLPGGYELISPDLGKMTPYSREAIMSALIEGQARSQ